MEIKRYFATCSLMYNEISKMNVENQSSALFLSLKQNISVLSKKKCKTKLEADRQVNNFI